MRAVRIASGTTIAPFGDQARDLYIGTRTLAQWQAEACAGAGLELVDVPSVDEIGATPAIAFFDDVFFTEMALRQLVADAGALAHDARLALPESAAWRAIAPLQDAEACPGGHAFDVFVLKEPVAKAADRAALRRRAAPRLQPLRERTIQLKLPRTGAGEVEIPFTDRIAAHVGHWLHLLRLSQLSIAVELIRRLRASPWRTLWLRLTAGRSPWAAARKMTFVDPTAMVHPTADLEAAVIGPGAVVRAHAHVHSSVVGEGVEIGDHAAVVGCTLAERAQVLRGSYLALSAAMPGATLSCLKAQLSLFGRDSFLTAFGVLLDAKLNGNLRIEHRGELFDLGTPYLGACLGHRVSVGAGVILAPARAIPNDTVLVAPPDQVLTHVDGRGGRQAFVRGGSLADVSGTPSSVD